MKYLEKLKRRRLIHLINTKKVLYLLNKTQIIIFIVFITSIYFFNAYFSTTPKLIGNLAPTPVSSLQENHYTNNQAFIDSNTFNSKGNESQICVRQILNITINLESPFNVIINSNDTMLLESAPINYSVELSNENHTYDSLTNSSVVWLIPTQIYDDGHYVLGIHTQLVNGTWLINNKDILIDNSPPEIRDIDLPWETIQPNTSAQLTMNITDLLTVVKVQVLVYQQSTHVLMDSQTFDYPDPYNLTYFLPELPLGFHGYIKIITEDEIGNVDDGRESYNFRVRSVAINDIYIEGLEPTSGIYTILRGKPYNLIINVTNQLLEGEEEKYSGNVTFQSDILQDWRTSITYDETYYRRTIYFEEDGICGEFIIDIFWFQILLNDEDTRISDIYTDEIKIYLLPSPGITVPGLTITNFFVTICLVLFYLVSNRYYGRLKYKEPLIIPKRNRIAFLVLILFTYIFWLVLQNGSIIPIVEGSFLPLLSNLLHPQSLAYALTMGFFLLFLFYNTFKMTTEFSIQTSETIKTKKIPDKFTLFVSGLVILIQLVYMIPILIESLIPVIINQNMGKGSILVPFSRYTSENVYFDSITFLALFVNQLFLLRYLNVNLKRKESEDSEALPRIYILIVSFLVSNILFSSIYIYYYPISFLFVLTVFSAILIGLLFYFIFNIFSLRHLSILPSNWTELKYSYVANHPQFCNIDLEYKIIHPSWITVTSEWDSGNEIQLNKHSETYSNISLSESLEFGVYRIHFYVYIRIIYDFFVKINQRLPRFPIHKFLRLKYVRLFEIKPFIKEELIFNFFKSLDISCERIADSDLNNLSTEGSKVYKIVSTSERYNQFTNSIVYMVNEPASVYIIRDCFQVLTATRKINQKYSIIIVPYALDVYAMLQRTLYHSKDEISIIPLIYTKIQEKSKFEKKKDLWRMYFDNSIKKYTVTEDLFDYTKAINPVGHPEQILFGREEILAKLQGLCELKQPFAILGFTKIGKSSIANVLVQSFKDTDLIFVIGISFTYENTVDILLEYIWGQWWDIISSNYAKTNIKTLEYDRKNPLISYKKLLFLLERELANRFGTENTGTRKFIVIFDELTALMRSELPQNEKDRFLTFLRFLIDEFPYITVGIVLHDDDITRNPSYPTSLYFKEIWITGLKHSASKQMILGLANQMHIKFPEKLAERITKHWDGHPFLVRSFCSLLYDEFGTDIPLLSNEEIQNIKSFDNFKRRENEAFWKIWNEQITENERKFLLKLLENQDELKLDKSYKDEKYKLVLKGVISKECILRSLAFEEWIRRQQI